jgi:hypothetical protein
MFLQKTSTYAKHLKKLKHFVHIYLIFYFAYMSCYQTRAITTRSASLFSCVCLYILKSLPMSSRETSPEMDEPLPVYEPSHHISRVSRRGVRGMSTSDLSSSMMSGSMSSLRAPSSRAFDSRTSTLTSNNANLRVPYRSETPQPSPNVIPKNTRSANPSVHLFACTE